MKKFLISAVLCSIVPGVCAHGYKIVGVTRSGKGRLAVITRRNPNPMENHVRISSCDLTGQILDANEFTFQEVSFMRGTDDPNYPVIWGGAPDFGGPCELWLAHWDGTILQPRLLLKEDCRLSFWEAWLFELDGQKKLFIRGYKPKLIRIRGDLQTLPTMPLYFYAFENGDQKLEREVTIAEGKTESDDFDVECAISDGEVHIWVCETGGRWSEGLLRVAKWQTDGELKWTECYRPKKGVKLGALTVDSLDGSAVAIFRYSRGSWLDVPATSCQLAGNTVSCVDLGRRFFSTPTKNQLLRVRQQHAAWLLMNYSEGSMRIVPLDDKLRRLLEVKRTFPYLTTSDLHLVCSSDRAVHIVTSTEDGRIHIEKLEDFAPGKPVPEQSVKQRILARFPLQTIEASYKAYTEGEGKNLLRATNDQLARDIMSGGSYSFSFFVSYYRLLSRDKKRAERCLGERIARIVKEGGGEEHWITNMVLAYYGEPAIKPLLKVAVAGGMEERRIAIATLCIIGDVGAIEELIKLLDRPEVRKDKSTFLMLCEMALMAGKPEGMDFLIKAATSKIVDEGTYEQRERVRGAREIIIEVTRDYKDTPETWAEKDWSEWWKENRGTLKLVSETADERAQRRREFESGRGSWRELARMLEEKRDD